MKTTSESGDVWKISWNLKIVATSVDTSNKNFQNSQNHIVLVFSGSHNIEISADFSDVSWFTGRNFALKSRFDNGFDNGRPSPAWIPQVPTSPPPVNGNEYSNPNVGMMAPPLNGGMGMHFPFYYPVQNFN